MTAENEMAEQIAGTGDGVIEVGQTGAGSWASYETPESAFAAIGYGMSFPDEVRGRGPARFLVIREGSRSFLSIEYWSESGGDGRRMAIVPVAVVRKGSEGMPPGLATDTTQHRHHLEMGGNAVTVCGNGVATNARWKVEDIDTGHVWHYYAAVGMEISDRELLTIIGKVE